MYKQKLPAKCPTLAPSAKYEAGGGGGERHLLLSLLCGRHCAKYFTIISSSDPQWPWEVGYSHYTVAHFELGQKDRSGFSVRCYGRTRTNFLANPILSDLSQIIQLSRWAGVLIMSCVRSAHAGLLGLMGRGIPEGDSCLT